MFANADASFVLIVLAIAAIIIMGVVKLVASFSPKTRCPKCYGILDADPWRYKGVIVWTCRDCNDTFETLRSGRQ